MMRIKKLKGRDAREASREAQKGIEGH